MAQPQRMLNDILARFEPLANVVFKPLRVESQKAAQPLLLPILVVRHAVQR
jgi:hypothetical protein